jgi:hypothetical protein
MMAGEFDGVQGALRFENQMAEGAEVFGDSEAEGDFVVDEKNGERGGIGRSGCDGRLLRLFLRRSWESGFVQARFRDGKENSEAGASAELRVQLNVPSKLANDAVDGGKTEAGAFADRLGGEKGLEDVIAGGFVHAATGVSNFEDEPIVLGSFAASRHGNGGRKMADVAGGNCEVAAEGHGIAGIIGEIGDDLFELRRIGEQPGTSGVVRESELNVGA